MVRSLLLHVLEDLSDRDPARYLDENLAAKWFCGFTLSETTMREQLTAAGLMSEGFTSVDATHLIAKTTLWAEREKARQQPIEKLNNEGLPNVVGGCG